MIAYIEGLTEKGLGQEICAHLEACAACQQEEKAVRGLQDRLVTQGQSHSADTLETAVLGRIVREQKSRMNRAEQAGAAVKLRSIIMKSSISRIAISRHSHQLLYRLRQFWFFAQSWLSLSHQGLSI